MKIILLLFVAIFGRGFVAAQQDPVLMCINGKDILRSEFECIYKKRKPLASSPTALTPKELATCVDEFVDFKLKVAQAQSVGIDTTADFRQRLAAYRAQLAKTYLTDEKEEEVAARRLYDQMEAYARAGQVQVMHIFKRLPQTLSASRLHAAEVQMDSLYQVLTAPEPADFAACVSKYSDDKKLFWMSCLETPDEFEKIAFSLQKGETSKPFYTPQGIHIVKVVDRKERLSFDDMRSDIAHRLLHRNGHSEGVKTFVDNLKSKYRYTPVQPAIEELFLKGETNQTLFTIDAQSYTGADFNRFAISYPRSVSTQFDAFVTKTILDYENDRLEKHYPAFHSLMQQHYEETLVGEISYREVMEGTVTNEDRLAAYFKLHQSKYHWDTPRYKGAVLHCADKKSAKYARKLLKKKPQIQWDEIIRQNFQTPSGMKVIMEHGLFAENDNPYIDHLVFKKRANAAPMESYPFTIIIGEKKRGPDTHQEVGEALKVDYQNFCNSLWINRLRSSAKVEINQEVLKTVNNH